MADRVLFISWGTPVRGREERGLEVFNEAIGICGRMQQEGRIENFDVVLLKPNGDINGYIQIHGSAEQIAAFHEDEEFQRNTVDAGPSSTSFGISRVDERRDRAPDIACTRRASRAFPRPSDRTAHIRPGPVSRCRDRRGSRHLLIAAHIEAIATGPRRMPSGLHRPCFGAAGRANGATEESP